MLFVATKCYFISERAFERVYFCGLPIYLRSVLISVSDFQGETVTMVRRKFLPIISIREVNKKSKYYIKLTKYRLFPIYQKNHWTMRWWDDQMIVPSHYVEDCWILT